MKFEFATSGRIIFGPGSINQVGPLASAMGKRAFIAAGVTPEQASPLLKSLNENRTEAVVFPIKGEPTIELIQDAVQTAKDNGCDLVIGFGGGSSMDTGKAVAILLNNPGEALDYLEVIGKGKSFTQPPLPCIAIPTTAGTGSEVTRNSVLSSLEQKVKVSMRSPLMLPKLVIVDPELTHSVPPAVTASTGLDALTQVLEPFVSNAANPITDSFCREGMARAARSLLKAYTNGNDAAAREDMALTSLLGGLSLANAKLGAVHGFAAVLGGMFNAPHGAVCAALLPHVISINVAALKTRQPESEALRRYDEVARILTGDPKVTATDGVLWIQKLCKALNVPGLGSYGMTASDFPEVIEKSAVASSMQGNPIKLTSQEMEEILKRAL